MISISVDSSENITLTASSKSGSGATYIPVITYHMNYIDWLDVSLAVHNMVDRLRKEFGTNE